MVDSGNLHFKPNLVVYRLLWSPSMPEADLNSAFTSTCSSTGTLENPETQLTAYLLTASMKQISLRLRSHAYEPRAKHSLLDDDRDFPGIAFCRGHERCHASRQGYCLDQWQCCAPKFGFVSG